MLRNDWEIRIEERLEFLHVWIYLYRAFNGKLEVAHYESGQLVSKSHDESEINIEPTFKLPLGLWDEMRAKLIDEKVRDKKEVESELMATKYHLEDMRKLLKIK